jgi:protein TonB
VVLVVVIPLLCVTDALPQVPSLMTAFVAAAPPPPPPPPPPPSDSTPPPVVERTPDAAPLEAPEGIAPEPPAADFEGGVPTAGLVGGIVGGMASVEPPLPPPPPAPPPAPVRIGGAIKQPALLSRVGPMYPPVAVNARVEGVVILELIVDREGCVENVKILRSIPLLDMAAMDAVRQWRYAPLVVNGHPARFLVTVTVSFNLS